MTKALISPLSVKEGLRVPCHLLLTFTRFSLAPLVATDVCWNVRNCTIIFHTESLTEFFISPHYVFDVAGLFLVYYLLCC